MAVSLPFALAFVLYGWPYYRARFSRLPICATLPDAHPDPRRPAFVAPPERQRNFCVGNQRIVAPVADTKCFEEFRQTCGQIIHPSHFATAPCLIDIRASILYSLYSPDQQTGYIRPKVISGRTEI